MNIPMKEPEVSLLIAIYYIKNNLTDEDIIVSLDGAHIKINGEVQFDVFNFMSEHGFKNTSNDARWQGEYMNSNYKQKILICSKSGIGDVNIVLRDGKNLFVESKKGSDKSGSPEYKLMREAVGQLMTNEHINADTIPAVAVPCYDKTVQLCKKWSSYKKITQAGIKFILVNNDGKLTYYPEEVTC